MATYLILNCAFLGFCIAALRVKAARLSQRLIAMAVVLLFATAIFDSLLIAANIAAYDSTKLLGIYIGKAPVEDFFYTLAAIIIIPTLWQRFNKQKGK